MPTAVPGAIQCFPLSLQPAGLAEVVCLARRQERAAMVAPARREQRVPIQTPGQAERVAPLRLLAHPRHTQAAAVAGLRMAVRAARAVAEEGSRMEILAH